MKQSITMELENVLRQKYDNQEVVCGYVRNPVYDTRKETVSGTCSLTDKCCNVHASFDSAKCNVIKHYFSRGTRQC